MCGYVSMECGWRVTYRGSGWMRGDGRDYVTDKVQGSSLRASKMASRILENGKVHDYLRASPIVVTSKAEGGYCTNIDVNESLEQLILEQRWRMGAHPFYPSISTSILASQPFPTHCFWHR